MPKLVGTVRSRAFRVIWMLEELGLSYDHIPAMPHTDEIHAVNPSGKVPAYVEDDGTIIRDSSAIITYLADKHGQLTYPAGSLERARQDALTFLILDEFDGPLWVTAKHTFGLPEELRVKAVKDASKWEFQKACERLAASMDSDFLMGDKMTIPDIILTHCLGWSMVAKFGFEEPTVQAFWERMRKRPAYIAAQAR